jgi:LPXTG-motif cell wall-anchored protein
MQHSYLTERDRRFPKSVIPGAVVLFVLVIRFSLLFANVTGERQAVAFGLFGLLLLVLAGGFIFWLRRKPSS